MKTPRKNTTDLFQVPDKLEFEYVTEQAAQIWSCSASMMLFHNLLL